jgi:hypothetical protein
VLLINTSSCFTKKRPTTFYYNFVLPFFSGQNLQLQEDVPAVMTAFGFSKTFP